jgi:hypothetical protein
MPKKLKEIESTCNLYLKIFYFWVNRVWLCVDTKSHLTQKNKGNFLELINFTAKGKPQFEIYIKNEQKFKFLLKFVIF